MINQVDIKKLLNQIDEINTVKPHMIEIQKFNQYIIGELNKIETVKNKKILDLGASKYGYALAESLFIGVKEYIGIDLDIDEQIEVSYKKSKGKLLKMNAEKLIFTDNYFDKIITISTFEHFLNPEKVLNEMHRVLKKNGQALITFGPIWSSAKGYHLHQYPNIAKYIPNWSHLLLNKSQMTNLLKRENYPNNLSLSLKQVVNWIYKDNDINRYDVKDIENYFQNCRLKTEWIVPLFDNKSSNQKIISGYLSTFLPYSSEQLMTRGFSILLSKK